MKVFQPPQRTPFSTHAAPTTRFMQPLRSPRSLVSSSFHSPLSSISTPQTEASGEQGVTAQSTLAQTHSHSLAHLPLFPPEKENKTGLPDTLKTGVEHLSGLSLDDVRVHYYSSKPAQVQALAYTQGTQIHVAPGQERHLAHEVWHVVQQKQGRVYPTFQAKGMELNDDRRLEHEADIMGEQATRLPSRGVYHAMPTGAIARAGEGHMASLAPMQRRVIQRRVGFEFEAAGGWQFLAKQANQNEPEPIKHTKASILSTPNTFGNLSADNGNVEFRTKPLSTLQQVTDTINELLDFYQRFRNKDTQLIGQELTTALAAINDAQHNYQQVEIHAQGNLIARPQATLGIKLADIPTLLNQLIAIRGTEKENKFAKRRTRIAQNYAQFGDAESLDRIVAGDVSGSATLAVQEAAGIYQRAVTAYAQTPNAQAEPQGARNEIVGFLTLVIKLLFDAYVNRKANEDMKYFFPLMPRTDLRSAFLSMEVAAQNFLIALWNAGQGPLYAEIQNWDDMTHRIFPLGYKADTGHNQGPTKQELFRSIIEPNQQNNGRDILSPAPGYNRLEGFGSMGVDDQNAKLVLLEFRGISTFTQGSTIGVDKWLPLAQTFFRLVNTITNPPQQQQPQQANVAQNVPNVPNGGANPPIAQQNNPVVQNPPVVQQNAQVVLPPALPIVAQIIPIPVQHPQNAINNSQQPNTKRQKK